MFPLHPLAVTLPAGQTLLAQNNTCSTSSTLFIYDEIGVEGELEIKMFFHCPSISYTHLIQFMLSANWILSQLPLDERLCNVFPLCVV